MKVALVGSPTLNRFTEGILRKGLELNGCNVISDLAAAEFAIIQIHGAPAAVEADRGIIRNLPKARDCAGSVILLHRPDEIKDSMPDFKHTLTALPASTGLVMLGDLLINDPFYAHPQLARRVIPHGFFDIDCDISTDPIVIGSHTTWGEMRSIERVLLLLHEISKASLGLATIGYIGGGPAESLSLNSVEASLEALHLSTAFALREVDPENWSEHFSSAPSNTIFLNAGAALPRFDVTFNVQLYHYGKHVRLGESSGSIHASAGIPVILEMNGSERIEQLEVIKVPYSDPVNVECADIEAAAQEIVNVIATSRHLYMLANNRRMARTWNHKKVAKLYIDFLEALAHKEIAPRASS
jgi:hypothetical protein